MCHLVKPFGEGVVEMVKQVRLEERLNELNTDRVMECITTVSEFYGIDLYAFFKSHPPNITNKIAYFKIYFL